MFIGWKIATDIKAHTQGSYWGLFKLLSLSPSYSTLPDKIMSTDGNNEDLQSLNTLSSAKAHSCEDCMAGCFCAAWIYDTTDPVLA